MTEYVIGAVGAFGLIVLVIGVFKFIEFVCNTVRTNDCIPEIYERLRDRVYTSDHKFLERRVTSLEHDLQALLKIDKPDSTK